VEAVIITAPKGQQYHQTLTNTK